MVFSCLGAKIIPPTWMLEGEGEKEVDSRWNAIRYYMRNMVVLVSSSKENFSSYLSLHFISFSFNIHCLWLSYWLY